MTAAEDRLAEARERLNLAMERAGIVTQVRHPLMDAFENALRAAIEEATRDQTELAVDAAGDGNRVDSSERVVGNRGEPVEEARRDGDKCAQCGKDSAAWVHEMGFVREGLSLEIPRHPFVPAAVPAEVGRECFYCGKPLTGPPDPQETCKGKTGNLQEHWTTERGRVSADGKSLIISLPANP